MKRPPNGARPRRARLAWVIAGASAAAAPCAALAQDVDPFSLSPEQLFDATVISASRTSEPLWNSPAAIYVISNEDITRSGVTSLPEALRLAPGVEVARTNSSTWAVSVRGFNAALANKLLVLVDGREVYDPLFSGVYWDVQDMPLQDVERIEIVRGPGASLWGANAVNGVINIITKSAAETEGGLLSVAGGNVDRSLLTARYGGGAGSVHWRIYGRYADRASFETVSHMDANGAWTQRRGGFRVDAEHARDTFTLQGDIYDSDSGQLRAVPLLVAPYADIAREHISAQGANVLGRWAHTFASEGRLTAQAYLDYTARDQISLNDKRTSFDFDTQYEFAPMDRQAIVAGFRYRTTRDAFDPTAIIFSDDTTNSEQLFSAFVQDRIVLVPDRWELTLGSKIDHNDFTGYEFQPNARVQWLNGDTDTAWAAVSRAVRTPSELERDLTVVAGVIPPGMLPLPISVQPTASPGFESEELIAYELGYRRRWSESVSTDIAAFYNRYEGLATLSLTPFTLEAPPLHIVLPIAYTNLTDGSAQGIEATLDWRLNPHLTISANYSLLEIELRGPPADQAISAEAAETTAPRNMAQLRARWDVNRNASLDAVLYYTDNIPGLHMPASTRLDVRAAWRLTDTIEWEVIGQNLLDSSRPEFGDPADPGSIAIDRNILARLTWRP